MPVQGSGDVDIAGNADPCAGDHTSSAGADAGGGASDQPDATAGIMPAASSAAGPESSGACQYVCHGPSPTLCPCASAQANAQEQACSQLREELELARGQLGERATALGASQQELARLRAALLDAEMDTQRTAASSDTLQQKLSEAQAALEQLRQQHALVRSCSAELLCCCV